MNKYIIFFSLLFVNNIDAMMRACLRSPVSKLANFRNLREQVLRRNFGTVVDPINVKKIRPRAIGMLVFGAATASVVGYLKNNISSFKKAVNEGDSASIQSALSDGIISKSDFLLNFANPLHIAAKNGQIDLLKLLIKDGRFDIDKADMYGNKFDYYLGLNNFDAVNEILEIIWDKEKSYLDYNYASDKAFKVKFTTTNCYPCSCEFGGGLTCCDTSFINLTVDRKELRKYIINKIDLNFQDKDYKTLLHHAVAKNDYITTFFLLKSEARINHKDKKGASPLFYVKNLNMYRLLKKFGVDINSDYHNSTVLHYISENNNLDPKLITEFKDFVNTQDNNYRTPFSNYLCSISDLDQEKALKIIDLFLSIDSTVLNNVDRYVEQCLIEKKCYAVIQRLNELKKENLEKNKKAA